MSKALVEVRVGVSGFCTAPGALVFRGAPWARLKFPAAWALIRHPQRGYLLFDTGYTQRFFAATEPFPERFYRWVTPVTLTGETAVEQLARWGVPSSSVGTVMLSHAHADHVAGLKDFPAARITAAPEAWNTYQSLGRWAQVRGAFLAKLFPEDWNQRFDPLPSLPWDWAGDGSLIVHALPGHGPGQIGLECATASGQIFLAADAAWNREELEGRALHPAAQRIIDDKKAYAQTQEWLRAHLAKHPGTRLVFAHDPLSFQGLDRWT